MIPRGNGGAGEKRNRQQQKTGSRAGKRRVEEKERIDGIRQDSVTVGRGILFLEIAQIVWMRRPMDTGVGPHHRDPMRVNQLLGELEEKLADFGDSSDP